MLSYADFKKYLSLQQKLEKKEPSDILEDILLPQMKYQAEVSFFSVRKKLNPLRRKHCFELFGLDYIIDADLGVWLVEINTNPCLEESSRLL